MSSFHTKHERRKLRKAYRSQKSHSRERGIEFLLTFDQWLEIWIKSGKLSQRGRGKNTYVMSRFGDVGPYVKSNVEIKSTEENASEGNLGKSVSLITRKKIAKALKGHQITETTRARMSASAKVKVFTPEHRANLREAALRHARAKL